MGTIVFKLLPNNIIYKILIWRTKREEKFKYIIRITNEKYTKKIVNSYAIVVLEDIHTDTQKKLITNLHTNYTQHKHVEHTHTHAYNKFQKTLLLNVPKQNKTKNAKIFHETEYFLLMITFNLACILTI